MGTLLSTSSTAWSTDAWPHSTRTNSTTSSEKELEESSPTSWAGCLANSCSSCSPYPPPGIQPSLPPALPASCTPGLLPMLLTQGDRAVRAPLLPHISPFAHQPWNLYPIPRLNINLFKK